MKMEMYGYIVEMTRIHVSKRVNNPEMSTTIYLSPFQAV